MRAQKVRKAANAARYHESLATVGLVAMFAAMLLLGVVATLHALFGIVSDAMTGVL